MAKKPLHKIRLLTALFYLGLLVFIAGFDETPDPGRIALLARPQPEIIEPENVWLYFVGMSAPADVAPLAYAADLMRRVGTNRAHDSTSTVGGAEEAGPRLEFVGDPLRDSATDGSMLGYAAEHPRDVVAYCRENRVLLQRYHELQTHSRYIEPIDYGGDMPFPYFSLIRNAQRTTLMRLAAQANRGEVDGALAGLQADAEFGRFLATEARTLISKLIAIALLRSDFQLAAEMGEAIDLTPTQSTMLDTILRPFENGEASMVTAIEGETRYLLNMIETTQQKNAEQSWMAELFYKKSATMNRVYAANLVNIDLAKLPPDQFFRKVHFETSDSVTGLRIGLPFFYNPAGEILARIAQSTGYANYIERGHDLEGTRRLAKLRALSRREGVLSAAMPAFLARNAVALGNLYTNEAMTWDAQTGRICYARAKDAAPLAIDVKRLQ